MTSEIFRLNMRDLGRALVMAALGGFITPILIAVETPGFDLLTANWGQILSVAFNGAIIAGVTYISKNFLTSEDGKFLGAI